MQKKKERQTNKQTNNKVNGVFDLSMKCYLHTIKGCRRWTKKSDTNNPSSCTAFGSTLTEAATDKLRAKLGKELDPTKSANHGSFYLRMGAVGKSLLSIEPSHCLQFLIN